MSAELFPVSDAKQLSPRLAWLKNHDVKTHQFSDPDGDDIDNMNHLGFGRWIAFVGKTIPPHEDSDRIWANGETEDDALVRLAKGMKWRMWNEEPEMRKPLNAR